MSNREVEDFLGWEDPVEDRARFQPINPDPDKSWQLKQFFIEHVGQLFDSELPDCFLCLPQRLLLVTKEGDLITRQYYRLTQGIIPSQAAFEVASEAHFRENDASYEAMDIELYGEHKDQQLSVSFLQIDRPNLQREGLIAIDLRIDSRLLKVYYDQAGQLVYFAHFVDNDKRYFVAVAYEKYRDEDVRFDSPFNDIDQYQSRYDRSMGVIILTRREDGKTKEVVEVPETIDRQEIIAQLFSKSLMDNPLEADPDLDNEWKMVNWQETFGIKWERY